MNLKNKISLIVSLLFTLIFGLSAIVIYLLFDDFRTDEFEARLKEKAVSTIKLLVEVEQVDNQLLKIIDQNNINKLYNEKTLIFDADFKLIYSSIDDTEINWSMDDLEFLKQHKTFFRKNKDQEIYGFFYDTNEEDFYALVSANDEFGKRKLEFLSYILIVTYILFTIICWFVTSYLVKKLLQPIDVFHFKLAGINEHNLDTRLIVKERKDEIDLLANEFNRMLERIDVSYQKQKEFTSNASHELRTPIARVTAQLQNKIIAEKERKEDHVFYNGLLNDINQISELISSLLILSKLDNTLQLERDWCRIDELILDAATQLSKLYPDFKLDFELLEVESLEILGNKSLLTIAFTNLLKNGYLYSESKMVRVQMSSSNQELKIVVINDGAVITEEESPKLFQPFMRGKNAKNSKGLGLGLRIVQRILTHHHASIEYVVSMNEQNVFTVLVHF